MSSLTYHRASQTCTARPTINGNKRKPQKMLAKDLRQSKITFNSKAFQMSDQLIADSEYVYKIGLQL